MPRPAWKPATAEAAVVLLAVGLAFAAGFAGWAVGHATRESPAPVAAASSAPVDPHVAAGAHSFVDFACSQCHGDQGRGGVSPDVPALTEVGKALTPAELRSIIDHGIGASGNPTSRSCRSGAR